MTSKLFIILALSSEGFVFFGHFYLSVSLFFAIFLAICYRRFCFFGKVNLATLCVVFRVARLALLRPNSINLAFLKWFGMKKHSVWYVRHSLSFFWPFLMVLAWKNIHCLAFFETSGSAAVVGLELHSNIVIRRFFWGPRFSLFCHGPILEDASGFAI